MPEKIDKMHAMRRQNHAAQVFHSVSIALGVMIAALVGNSQTQGED